MYFFFNYNSYGNPKEILKAICNINFFIASGKKVGRKDLRYAQKQPCLIELSDFVIIYKALNT